jgi:hypothetical protein
MIQPLELSFAERSLKRLPRLCVVVEALCVVSWESSRVGDRSAFRSAIALRGTEVLVLFAASMLGLF